MRVFLTVLSFACAACASEEVEIPHPPLAFAGFDGRVVVGENVALDASRSSDPDGDVLAYTWRIQAAPPGSRAEPASISEMVTTFVPDRAGTFVFSLSVSDGRLSARDLVSLTATSSRASPEPRPSLALEPSSRNLDLDGARVTFIAASDQNGTLAADLMRAPAGATREELALEVAGQEISFLPSRPGEYWISAYVLGEDGALRSPPAIATVAVYEGDAAARPLAVISGARTASRNMRVLLDGRASSGAALELDWSLAADPSGGADQLVDVATGCPTGACRLLWPTAAGSYVVALAISASGLSGVTAVHAIEVRP